MWPVLLNMTRDECRLTLRRLELEAYSNMIDVFRAQGALEDSRKKLLEELRAVLHISQDRHSAEARRVSNDHLLATIAEKLSGPNTNLGWICEGRRRIPLLPRGVPQTAYTEIADKAVEAAVEENKELQKRLAAEKEKSKEEIDNDGVKNEDVMSSNETPNDDMFPLATEDQTLKLWETELISRKRKITESSATGDETTVPVKNMRNIPVNPNQKHLNLSQIYSKLSQSATSKPVGQSKHSYNQVSKVSTSKSSLTPRATPHKHKTKTKNTQPKQPKQPKQPRSKKAKQKDIPPSPNKQYNTSIEYSGPPNTFQASYAKAVLGGKIMPEYPDELKPKIMSSPNMVTDSPTMQLLTQPAKVPHELEVSENAHPDDHYSLKAQSTPVSKQTVSGKPCQLILQNRGEVKEKKPTQKSDIKQLQKQTEGIKLLSNKQVVVTPSSAAKVLSTPGKLVTTKVIGSIPKPRTSTTPATSEKLIVISKPTTDVKNTPNKMIVTSGANSSSKERTISTSTIPRIVETLTPKGIPATDLKVSAKAVVLNPKSGQKMVVVPAKSRTKPGNEGQIPLIHFKGITTAMKLVPVSSQSISQATKSSSAVTVVSKPSNVSNTKVIGMEPIKTANLADIVPVKGMTPVSSSKITNPIVRPSSAKGNVIVVQKAANLGKALSFAKNGNDMSKIIMGKNVTQLLQASKAEHPDVTKAAGNVIVLELNNEQTGRPTTMSEILDSRSSSTSRLTAEKKIPKITQDTPVLFENQMTEETCNANSLDSTVESISGMPMEDSSLSIISKEEAKSNYSKDSDGAKDSSSVTDWEMELDTVTRKDKDDDDKLNSMHLDLGMSSDSDTEYMATGRKKSKLTQDIQRATTSGESGEMYSGSSAISIATRTLLSQLQDDGSSSNDSSFALKARIAEKNKDADTKLDKTETDELTKAKEKLFEKVADVKSQQKRIDVYSTAITTSDINLDSFAYLDEGMMAGDDVCERPDALHEHLTHLLAPGEHSPHSTHSQTVSESMPLSKQ